ncbi:MAG: hypothetical protein QOJ99_2299, partial [Bryobacterales bacterium]|nr:hypothetical protein [Bryobacterales bacterium]
MVTMRFRKTSIPARLVGVRSLRLQSDITALRDKRDLYCFSCHL